MQLKLKITNQNNYHYFNHGTKRGFKQQAIN
jgi:hypothetical protein